MRRRIIFMGTPDFAVPAFEAVRAAHDIVAVYTKPPAKQGRGMKLTLSPVHAAAQAADIPVLTPATLKSDDALAAFRAFDAELAVVVAYGMILPQAWLDAPVRGCWNIHASLLPRWRGAAPIQRALMAGDGETGIAVMQMQAGLDTGPVLLEKRLAISADDTAQSLHDKLAHLGGAAIGAALAEPDALTATPQAAQGVTYAEKIDKDEARIDFTRSATDLDAHIRALSPFPGAWFDADGQRVKILQATAIEADGPVGTVAADAGASGVMIYCGSGALVLQRLQKAGKPALSADEFMRGRGLAIGQKLD